jgi:hypothetical protein
MRARDLRRVFARRLGAVVAEHEHHQRDEGDGQREPGQWPARSAERGARRPAREIEPRGVLEDLAFQAAELGIGLQPQLLGQLPASVLVDAQRVRLPARAVQGEHELAAQVLAVRVARHQRLQLPGERGMTAEREIGVDALLQRGHAQLVEPGDLGPRERVVREVDEHRAAPERERLAEPGDGALRVAARAGSFQPSPEAVGIDLARRGVEAIAVPDGLERATVVERGAEPGDMRLKRLDGRGRRLLTPQLVDQPLARHHLVRVQEQNRQQPAWCPASDLDLTILVEDLEWAKDAELHGASLRVRRPPYSPTIPRLQPDCNRASVGRRRHPRPKEAPCPRQSQRWPASAQRSLWPRRPARTPSPTGTSTRPTR